MKIDITKEIATEAASRLWYAEGGSPNYDLWQASVERAIAERNGDLPEWMLDKIDQARFALEAVAPIIADQVLERAAQEYARRPDVATAIRALKDPTP